jgi:hypothetical protein
VTLCLRGQTEHASAVPPEDFSLSTRLVNWVGVPTTGFLWVRVALTMGLVRVGSHRSWVRFG